MNALAALPAHGQTRDPALDAIPPEAPSDQAPQVTADHPSSVPVSFDILHGLRVELWNQWFSQRDWLPSGVHNGQSDEARLVLDYRNEWSLGSGLRLIFSDRLDQARSLVSDRNQVSPQTTVNVLREAYVDAQLGAMEAPFYLDLGRINVRNGVGSGYNPTDFFKAGSNVVSTTFDPAALREDRLGTVMVKAQQVMNWGSWTAAYAPRLASTTLANPDERVEPAFSLDLDRTNRFNAGYVKIAPQISERVSIDALFYAREQQEPRFGTNISALLSNSVVVNLEAVVGRFPLLAGPDVTHPRSGYRARAAANVVWTLPSGIELTLEHIYAGDALSNNDWRKWRRAQSAADQLRLSQIEVARTAEEEPLVQNAWFGRAAWHDAFHRPGLDLSGFVQVDSFDGSALWQVSASQALSNRWSVTAQGGGFVGALDTEYGSSTLKNYAVIYLTFRH